MNMKTITCSNPSYNTVAFRLRGVGPCAIKVSSATAPVIEGACIARRFPWHIRHGLAFCRAA
jgi:hypothetical protein